MSEKSLLRSEITPFILIFTGVIGFSLGADLVLHKINISWVGRSWGYFGSLLILLSFIYSLRKLKLIRKGSPGLYLKMHEYLGWTGALMVLMHGGTHFNGLLAWLAMTAMLVTILSGLTGKILLRRSRKFLSGKRKALIELGLNETEIDEKLYWDSTAVKTMKKWRAVHIPVTSIFITLTLAHVVAVLCFWNW
ncbi:MAG: hypothetical protein HQK83_12790 [Fibrobacteria bacterium]|nr:hypothetical protein [Fibrobacteria bacterium]